MADTSIKLQYPRIKSYVDSALVDGQRHPELVCDTNRDSTLKLNIKELFLKLPDKLFYDLLKTRLNGPILEENIQEDIEDGREYWIPSYAAEQLHTEISRVVTTITVNGKEIHVNKYYNRALKIFKFISVAKSDLEFIINISDLSPRLIAELKTLDKITVDYVLKLAVGGIFENISSKRYRSLGVAKRLKVSLDR